MNTQKTIKDLDFIDTVWIKDKSGTILEGWVFDITKKHVIVTVPLDNNQFLDYRFIITRPLSQTTLSQSHNILYLNNPWTKET